MRYELVSVNGQVYYSEIHADFSISKGIQIDVDELQSGNCMVRMVFGNKSVMQKGFNKIKRLFTAII
jgi:hypothetical protein